MPDEKATAPTSHTSLRLSYYLYALPCHLQTLMLDFSPVSAFLNCPGNDSSLCSWISPPFSDFGVCRPDEASAQGLQKLSDITPREAHRALVGGNTCVKTTALDCLYEPNQHVTNRTSDGFTGIEVAQQITECHESPSGDHVSTWTAVK